MSGVHSRRSVLAGAGYAAAMGTVAGQMLSVAHAAEAAGEAAVCMTMAFVNSPKAKFDAGYYREKHLPMLKGIFGESVERFELRVPHKPAGSRAGASNQPSAPMPMGPPQLLLAAVSVWIRDVKVFGEKTAAASQEIIKDLANVTDVQPALQYDRVVLLLGDARSDIAQDAQVFSTYWRAAEGGKFDAKYYGEQVVPQMVKAYGKEAIRRIELTVGSSGQGGAKPVVAAAAHYYIRNRQAWDAGGMKAFPMLMAEGPKYTTLMPVIADADVAAVG